MKQVKLLTIVLFSLVLFPLALSNHSYAHELDENLEKMCHRQAIVIATELSSNTKKEFTAQDVSMLRIGAMQGCMKTCRRMQNLPDQVNTTTKDETIAAKPDSDSKQNEAGDKKESIFDRLLRSGSNDDPNPMQKKHRTGGK